MVIILMGVSGCGKTTVGQILARDLDLPFFDADDFHPPENVQKMKQGMPLNDTDRQPWLEILSDKIKEWDFSDGAVLACSALKEKYRTFLDSENTEVVFVYLKGPKQLILERIKNRIGHYMPSNLLDSQFKTLEEPKKSIVVSIENSPPEISNQIKKNLQYLND